MTSSEHVMRVQRGRFIPAHERVEYDSGSILDLDSGRAYGTLSSGFHCVCGNQMHDGDPYATNEQGDFAHERCAHLLEKLCPACHRPQDARVRFPCTCIELRDVQ